MSKLTASTDGLSKCTCPCSAKNTGMTASAPTTGATMKRPTEPLRGPCGTSATPCIAATSRSHASLVPASRVKGSLGRNASIHTASRGPDEAPRSRAMGRAFQRRSRAKTAARATMGAPTKVTAGGANCHARNSPNGKTAAASTPSAPRAMPRRPPARTSASQVAQYGMFMRRVYVVRPTFTACEMLRAFVGGPLQHAQRDGNCAPPDGTLTSNHVSGRFDGGTRPGER